LREGIGVERMLKDRVKRLCLSGYLFCSKNLKVLQWSPFPWNSLPSENGSINFKISMGSMAGSLHWFIETGSRSFTYCSNVNQTVQPVSSWNAKLNWSITVVGNLNPNIVAILLYSSLVL
jgi:hypothetical protein